MTTAVELRKTDIKLRVMKKLQACPLVNRNDLMVRLTANTSVEESEVVEAVNGLAKENLLVVLSNTQGKVVVVRKDWASNMVTPIETMKVTKFE